MDSSEPSLLLNSLFYSFSFLPRLGAGGEKPTKYERVGGFDCLWHELKASLRMPELVSYQCNYLSLVLLRKFEKYGEIMKLCTP